VDFKSTKQANAVLIQFFSRAKGESIGQPNDRKKWRSRGRANQRCGSYQNYGGNGQDAGNGNNGEGGDGGDSPNGGSHQVEQWWQKWNKAGGDWRSSEARKVEVNTSGNNQTESRRKWWPTALISFSYDCERIC